MRIRSRHVAGLLTLLAASCLSLTGTPACAADHFLTIGGGDGPNNNQVSLEKNVLFFRRLLADKSSATPAQQDVLFADGLAGARGLQVDAPDETPRLNLLLARLANEDGSVDTHWRKHEIPNVRGPSTRQGLNDWFTAVGSKLPDGDRLFIYFTGHGGSGPKNNPQDTTLSMWNERPMPCSEFTKLLDRVSPKVRVVLIMVQCHAGGFAGTLFNDGNFKGKMSPARRVGFFATKADRNAAGCTSDAHEEDYKDYSTYFFAALDGKTRTGKPVIDCDLDGDGRVSFAEAHAYTLVHSDTIDIPTNTSECILRTFGKPAAGASSEGLVAPESPYRELLDRAAPLNRAVLEGLSDALKLTTDNRYDEAKRLADLVEAQRKTVERDRNGKNAEREKLSERLRKRLTQRWPELANPWNPRVPELLKTDGPEIQRCLDLDSDCPRWELLYRDIDQLDTRELDLERKWAKCQRFIRMMETVALAATFEKVAPPTAVERYKQILQDEAGTLGVKE